MFFSPDFPHIKEEYPTMYTPTETGALTFDVKTSSLDDDNYINGTKSGNVMEETPKIPSKISLSASQQYERLARSDSRTSSTGTNSRPVNENTIITSNYQFPQVVEENDDVYHNECMTLQAEDILSHSVGRFLQPSNRQGTLGHYKCSSPQLELEAMNNFKSNSQSNIEYLVYQNYHITRQYHSPLVNQQSLNTLPAVSEPITPPESLTSLHRHKVLMSSDISTSSGTTSSSISSSTRESKTPEFGKPRIETTYWEDEDTKCYQVNARGYLVSRREDNNYINGTKLLNVIGMSRGKRDGILKAEKNKTVVKLGSMNLKGVWIPFERAIEIARNNGVDGDNLLGPLFIEDIKSYFETTGYRLRVQEDNVDSPMYQKLLYSPPRSLLSSRDRALPAITNN